MSMKNSLFVIFTLITVSCTAQKSKNLGRPLLHVKDWGQKSYSVAQEFWNKVQPQMLQQVSQEEFEKIKTYSQNEKMPEALLLFDGQKLTAPFDTYYERMRTLKVYRIAEVTHINNGKNYGKYIVAAVPYQSLSWSPEAKWDTVYFVFRSAAVEDSITHTNASLQE